MTTDDVTPIRQQYLEIKRQYPNAILFFRLGDFYETFDQDAETTSRELDLVLTSRPVARGTRVPMAGIPYHAVENYLARLIEKGYHVAICEQVGEQPIKGLFPRQVVRVVTPGTIVEPGLLKGDRNNYLASIVQTEDRAAIAYADITTGEFAVAELEGSDTAAQLRAECLRLHVSEVLLPENAPAPDGTSLHLSHWPAWRFEPGRCQQTLQKHFQVAALDGFGLRGMTLAIQAAGALLQYLQETQPAALNLLNSLSTYSLNDFMTLDAATRRNLELTETIRTGEVNGSLLGVLDHSITPMGKRLIRQWVSKPLLSQAAIEARQDGVAFFLTSGLLRSELRNALRPLNDLERLTNRILSGHATPRDLQALRSTLQGLPALHSALQAAPTHPTALQNLLAHLHLCQQERTLLEAAISDDPPATLQNPGVIRPGYSAELDDIIESSRHARQWIANLESVERQRTGIKNLKVGYNKVFGYYIEITNSNTDMVPAEYIRKQTLVNAERYITPQMKEYEALVLNAEERIRDVEGRIFRQVCTQIGNATRTLLETARTIAELDALAALAEAAAIGGYVRPQITNDACLEIQAGRHPVVERTRTAERFVPNDACFEEGEIVRLITGPNMSGKSTFLRQVALIVLMAQIGSFVPAQSARIGLVDRIFTRIGAQDEIHAGQSTFMVEMIEAANILHHATPRSLLILDEIGRGTSTYDGLSIAWAIIEYIHNHPQLRARTLFATHYHELTQLSELLPGVRNYNVAVSETQGQVIFLHKIIPGGADRSYGIHVAQLAGLPRPVIQRASQILQELEASSGKAVHLNPTLPQQMALFPETNPLREELQALDINTLSPIEALNKLYEWKRKYTAA
ncbi:MAG: DNA mismatch repair protein MutS [Longilinea sp.]|nr:DNA mismatch repair protein MutS [Longilinea sp.]MCA1954424.1 DNA mismatch repair protein MutS [Anaerolinea sp.]